MNRHLIKGTFTRRETLLKLGALAGTWVVAEGFRGWDAMAAADGLTTLKLTDHLHVIMGAGGNIAILTGQEGAVMVDTGLKPQIDAVLTAAKTVTPTPIRLVINTHWHGDHTGGNETLGDKHVPILAHTNCRKRLSTDQVVEFMDMKAPALSKPGLPSLVFDDSMTLFLNDEEIYLKHIPTAHTDTDIVLHFRKSNVLHTGDLLFNGLYPFIDYSTKGWIGGMAAAADKIIAMTDTETKIIPGHGPIATRADVQEFRTMLATIQDHVEKLIKDGKTVDEVVAAKPTADFDAKWGKGFLSPDKFAKLTYLTITKHQA